MDDLPDKSAARALGCRCDECPLLEAAGPVLPERGGSARYTVLSDYPDQSSAGQGRPFTGPSEALLKTTLRSAKIARRDTVLAYTVMCRGEIQMKKVLARVKSQNAARRKENTRAAKAVKGTIFTPKMLPMLPTPMECCAPGVHKLLARAPRHILAAGKLSAGAVLGGSPSIFAIRGGILDGHITRTAAGGLRLHPPDSPLPKGDVAVVPNARVVPTLDPGLVQAQMRWEATLGRDLDRLVRWSQDRLEWREPDTVYSPPPHELAAFLAGPGPYTYDVETDGITALDCNIRCIGIGDPEGSVVVVGLRSRSTPLSAGNGDDHTFYTPWVLRRIRAILAAFFADRTKIKVGHNSGYYDYLAMRAWLTGTIGQPWKWVPESHAALDVGPNFDNILVHRVVESELPHRLGFVGSKYTDVHAWKSDRAGRKLAIAAETDRELHHYCLAEGTRVVLGDGTTRPIEQIVRNKEPVDVLTHWGGRVQPMPVTGWFYTVEDDVDWRQIRFRGDGAKRGLVCTADHGIYVEGRGLVEAQDVCPGMRVLHHESRLEPVALQALVGTLVGDTHLCVSPSFRGRAHEAPTAYVQGGHTESSGFAQYKCQSIPALSLGDVRPARDVRINGRAGRSSPFRAFRSRSLHQLAEILPLVLDERGRHRLSVEALEYMGDAGLAWLYMDDGCVQRKKAPRHSETCVLALQRYPRAQLEAVLPWLRRTFGNVYLGADGVFRFSVPASEAFARRVARYLPEEARYKLPRIVGADPWQHALGIPRLNYPAPSTREVVSVGRYYFNVSKRHQRYRARRRYCLGVEGPHNFFTTHGLVSNCGIDVAVTRACTAPLVRDAKIAEQDGLIAIDHAVQRLCADMHHAGMFVDQPARAEAERDALARTVSLRKEIAEIVGDSAFNPGSTQQLQRLLFRDWGLTPSLDDKIRFTDSGGESTNDDVLRALFKLRLTKQQRRFVVRLRQYRSVMKALGTYIVKLRPMTDVVSNIGWDDDAQRMEWEAEKDPELLAMMRAENEKRGYEQRGIVWADGRMRPGYNAHVTVSGRLSSSSPINAQNFPKYLRKLIIPQPGNVLVGADYDQLELRVAAARWGLTKYLDAFEAGWDPHTSVTAFAVFGEEFAKVAGSPFPWMTGTKFTGDAHDMRQLAKIIQYAYQYKASVETGARIIQATEFEHPETGDPVLPYARLSVKQVRQMRDAWLSGIPGLPRGWDSEIQHFRDYGWVGEPIHGRRRFFLDGENPNELVNTPIQFGASAIVNGAMTELHKDIPLHKWGPGTGILTQTHDALVVECPAAAAPWVVECMNHHMNTTHPAFPGVTFTANAEIGKTWKEVG